MTPRHACRPHRQNNNGEYDFGLIYMNARYYLPEIGRFISADTIVPEPSNPQSHNRYSYVRNSPMTLIDPTGHRECIDQRCDVVLNEHTNRPVMRGPLPTAIQYIHSDMTQNARGGIALVIRTGNAMSLTNGPIGKGVAYIFWGSQVMDARIKRYLGPLGKYVANWDHKPLLLDDENSPVPEIATLDGWSTVGSRLYRFDIWSNIHYGYVGASTGFPSSELTGGAGVEQVGPLC